MRHTSPETKRRYQLGMAEQMQQPVDKANKRVHGKRNALHLRDSAIHMNKEAAVAGCS